jgi:hypothetical protein
MKGIIYLAKFAFYPTNTGKLLRNLGREVI